MTMQRCIRCQGSKKIAPMGGIYVNCTECQGIGYVEKGKSEGRRIEAQAIPVEPRELDLTTVEIANEVAPIVMERKRPGRPKKQAVVS